MGARRDDRRIAVGVSGAGSQPAGAGRGREARGARRRGGRSSSPIGRARRSTGRPSRGSTRPWSRAATIAALAETLAARPDDVVVLAGYMRLVGPRVDRRGRRGSSNTHPSLLPAFPGLRTPSRDALAARRRGHRRARSTSSTRRSTAARSSPRRRCRSCPATTRRRSRTRIRPVEHRLLPRCRGAARRRGARRPDGRRVTLDRPLPTTAAASRAAPSCRSSDKTGLVGPRPRPRRARLRARLAPAAPPGRCATRACRSRMSRRSPGFPEMLDGRVKTLHPRVHAGLLADRRLRRPSRGRSSRPAIAPFELVVVNLYPFAAAAERARASRSTPWSRRSTSAGRRWSAPPPRTTRASRS